MADSALKTTLANGEVQRIAAKIDRSLLAEAVNGITPDTAPLYRFINSLLTFENVWSFERKFAEN